MKLFAALEAAEAASRLDPKSIKLHDASTQDGKSDVHHIGNIKSFNVGKGYGFVACDAVNSIYKRDAFLTKEDFAAAGFPPVGSKVVFKVHLNPRGLPQASELSQIDSEEAAQLRKRGIRKQVEWYFSDANLSVDDFFYAQICDSGPDGWVPVRYVLKCSKICNLGATANSIWEALADSHLETKLFCKCSPCTEMSEHLFVRRRQPLPPFVGREHATADGTVVDVRQSGALDCYSTIGRLEDQKIVQETLGLKEIGDEQTIFREVIDDHLLGAVIARGYERVVYGDHGPYLEFTENHINWDAWPHFHDKSAFGAKRCYDEYFTPRSFLVWQERWQASKNSYGRPKPNADGLLMLYAQTQTVGHRPWAPGRCSPARKAGYADYRENCFYVAASSRIVGVEGLRYFFVADWYKDGTVVDEPIPEHAPAQALTNNIYVCWQWQQGCCRKGAACKWLHL